MLGILKTRLAQGHRTTRFPDETPTLPERYRGRPAIDSTRCPPECNSCAAVCPTEALTIVQSSASGVPRVQLDLGRCLFCTACCDACPTGALQSTREFRLATAGRADLVLTADQLRLAEGMARDLQKTLGRALRLRQVCAGGCNGCELDTNVLNTVGWDLSRFGIQFVASPRHADGLLITGPVTQNMRPALLETYAAVPPPRVVIAVGACAISGGPFRGNPAVHDGAEGLLPIDLYIPGCPPHPLTTLDGLLRLVGRTRSASPTARPPT